MFVLVYAPHLCYHVHMKRDQINPQPILCVLGFFVTVCTLAIVVQLVQAISALFAV